MTLFTDAEPPRLSVGSFSKIPGIIGLEDIKRTAASSPGSVASSSHSFSNSVIDRAEPCLVTGSILYTHERVHWINAVRSDVDKKGEIISFIRNLRITPPDFSLEDASNLANLDRVVHKSLDAYAFIAVTGTRETLAGLIDLVRADNDRRQERLDSRGHDLGRHLDFEKVFQHSQFELVALHPEHFLPGGSVLTVYDYASQTRKTYLPSTDRRLRESPDSASPLLPSFPAPSRILAARLNPLLVIINAEIKFRRYLRMDPPTTPLPDDVHELMRMSKELVDLIYWVPTATPGSEGARVIKDIKLARVNPARDKRPRPEKSDVEGMAAKRVHIQESTSGGANRFPWPEGADLETRVEMGSALLSGHDLDYSSEDDEFLEDLHRHDPSSMPRGNWQLPEYL